MIRTDVAIVGGGQAGLAMSRALSMRGIDHAVLERGRTGERWRSERWNSLHLLTNCAYSALPGLPHTGCDPERFLPASDFADYLDRYAAAFAVPLVPGAEVASVEPRYGRYRIASAAGSWDARAVVIATGACDAPYVPPEAAKLDRSIVQVLPNDYRAPSDLPDGNVLVVGASSTGTQLAEEIHRSGRQVTLAVGDHTRMVRRWRGRDIFERMDAAGILDDAADDLTNAQGGRRQPSAQLVGRPDRSNLDLPSLDRLGVRLVGRLGAIEDGLAFFKDDLAQTTAKSHGRMINALQRIDRHIERSGEDAPPSEIDAIEPFVRTADASTIDLRRQNIRTVVWATGYRRNYGWLNVPVLAENGEVVQRGGVTPAPGLYILGLNFLRRRRSAFIDGCGKDAEDIAHVVQAHLRGSVHRAA